MPAQGDGGARHKGDERGHVRAAEGGPHSREPHQNVRAALFENNHRSANIVWEKRCAFLGCTLDLLTGASCLISREDQQI